MNEHSSFYCCHFLIRYSKECWFYSLQSFCYTKVHRLSSYTYCLLHILKKINRICYFARRFAFEWYVQIQCNRKEVCNTNIYSEIIVMVEIIGILCEGYFSISTVFIHRKANILFLDTNCVYIMCSTITMNSLSHESKKRIRDGNKKH